MWSPWMSAKFNIHRPDIVNDNITLYEIIAMWDVVKEGAS
jgi:hypothetical protein